MERRLIVMRHAKSSWDAPARTDHERPLNARGQRDAPRVGEALAQLGWVPDLVLSSDSLRTRETMAGMIGAFARVPDVKFLPSFYHAGPAAAEREVPLVKKGVGCLLLLGHNPGWEDLVHTLSGREIAMKTATAALLKRELPDWTAAFDGGRWALDRVIYPRELED